jgi:hypothetical protein
MRVPPVAAITVWLTLLGGATGPVGAAGAVTAGLDLTVRVYDASGLPPATIHRALELANGAFAPASIRIAWVACGPARHDLRPHRCDRPPRPGELVVRMISAPSLTGDRDRLPLGDAFVDPRAGAGVLATVYVDRVAALAAAAGVDVAPLLGNTIAHELGHLLLATTAHGPRGLMRPVWTPDEVRRGHPSDWRFAPREVSALRARLRHRA